MLAHERSTKKIPLRIKRSKAERINVVLRYVSVLRSTTYQRIMPSLVRILPLCWVGLACAAR